jgi:hypothetical protein
VSSDEAVSIYLGVQYDPGTPFLFLLDCTLLGTGLPEGQDTWRYLMPITPRPRELAMRLKAT